MEARPDTHPSAAVLQAFGLGKLDDAAAETVLDHLETCSDCRKEVAAQSGDTFLDRLRQAHRPSNTPAPGRFALRLARRHRAAGSAPTGPYASSNVAPELASHPQYEIVRELGRGGMGVVYLARNRLMARLEVLKVVNKDLLERSGGKDRFLREIQSAAMLNHPNVVAAYSALPVGELLVFAMEYVEGEDLAKVVKERGPLPVLNACYYVQQAAMGLQHAFEKKMVHRDIKPQNLILREEARHQGARLRAGQGAAREGRGHRADRHWGGCWARRTTLLRSRRWTPPAPTCGPTSIAWAARCTSC